MLLISHCECGSKSRSLFLSWIFLVANWKDAWMRRPILLFAVSLDSCIIYWILTNFEKKLNSFKSHTQTIARQLFQKRSFTFASISRAVAWKFLVTSALNFTGRPYRTLTEHSLQGVFPNLGNALRMYLCLMVSNCSGERSFSALKRIKNVLRSKMLDEKLNHLSIMSTESGVLRKLDFSDIISEFVKRKARKMFY